MGQLVARAEHPALISFGRDGVVELSSKALAEKTLSFAHQLCAQGVDKSDAVAVWAREAALNSSHARFILTTARHLDASSAILRAHNVAALCVDDELRTGEETLLWPVFAENRDLDSPVPADDAPAIMSWTSGTTGSPKAFVLTHRNIATNVEALQQMAAVGRRDRALLPLPLHHVYPFIVGMLTTLTLGTAIVLPSGTTGSALMRALREGDVTTIIGVPRLYEALVAAIDTRFENRRFLRLALRALLEMTVRIRQASGLCVGRLLFAPVRRAVAPRLCLLVSGGARLEKHNEERLEALGWMVLSGYGLAETASLFTGNSPSDRRAGSAGRPLADGEVRKTRTCRFPASGSSRERFAHGGVSMEDPD